MTLTSGSDRHSLRTRAGAGEIASGEVADFNLIDHAAGGLDAEDGENGVCRIEVLDCVFFIAGALDAAVDLVLVGGAPVAGGRLGDRVGFLLFGLFRGHDW